ncbi:head-tail adaptor protein [Aerococcaceae bacterium WGS1372]
MANNDRLFSTRRKKRKLKDKKIDFVKREQATNEYGSPIRGVYTYVDYLTNRWAYVRQTSAEEEATYVARASKTNYIVELLFTINYTEGITNDLLIRFKDEYYAIERIDHFEFYKEDIVISARRYVLED